MTEQNYQHQTELDASQYLGTGTILDGKYEILAFIGCGGMGAVYKARHIEIDNLVAIKVMHPTVNAPRATMSGASRPLLSKVFLALSACLLLSIPILTVMPLEFHQGDGAPEEVSPEQLIAQADMEVDAHHKEAAAVYLKRALKVANPTPAREVEVYKRLADLYLSLLDPTQELIYRRRCAELAQRPGASRAEKRDANRYLGKCYCALERYCEAVDPLEKALYYGDTYDSTKMYFGIALFYSGRYFDLSPQAAARVNPDHQLTRDLGACYVLRKALPELPDSDKLVILDLLSASYLKLGRYSEAEAMAKQMQPFNPLQAKLRLSTILTARGALKQSASLSAELLKTPKIQNYPRLFLGTACNLSLIAYRQGQYETAAKILDSTDEFLVGALPPAAHEPITYRRYYDSLLSVHHAREVSRQLARQAK